MNALPPLKRNSVVLVVGPRGSGKTVLATELARAQRHVTVFDTKLDFSWNDPHPYYGLTAYNVEDVLKCWRGIEAQGDGAPVIYRPDVGSPSFHADVDRVAAIALQRKNCLLYYDELADICSVSNYERVAPSYKRAVMQGRSLGVGVWQVTQRPARIPLIAYTEADLRATFFLRSKSDRDRVEEYMGEVPWRQLAITDHAFVYSDDKLAQSDEPLQPHRLILPHPPQRSANYGEQGRSQNVLAGRSAAS